MESIIQVGLDRATELAALNAQLIEDEGHRNSMSISELASRMGHWLSSGYDCYAIEGEGIIESYCLFRDDGEYFYIRQLFTARHLRNTGKASKLLEYLETTCFKSKPIRLEVLVGNTQAQQFYLSRGYSLYSHTLEKI